MEEITSTSQSLADLAQEMRRIITSSDIGVASQRRFWEKYVLPSSSALVSVKEPQGKKTPLKNNKKTVTGYVDPALLEAKTDTGRKTTEKSSSFRVF